VKIRVPPSFPSLGKVKYDEDWPVIEEESPPRDSTFSFGTYGMWKSKLRTSDCLWRKQRASKQWKYFNEHRFYVSTGLSSASPLQLPDLVSMELQSLKSKTASELKKM
jgi:hypothetical protein